MAEERKGAARRLLPANNVGAGALEVRRRDGGLGDILAVEAQDAADVGSAAQGVAVQERGAGLVGAAGAAAGAAAARAAAGGHSDSSAGEEGNDDVLELHLGGWSFWKLKEVQRMTWRAFGGCGLET